MSKTKKELFIISDSYKNNSNNINRGKPIYYDKKLHYIVYEFDDKIIISNNEDLKKAFCVKKSSVSVKPKK
jgi:hypothetical protein